jgi:uncharacterized protein (TIGR00255 family)
MTGFGEASCEADGVHYAVELRSLNNRYFKAIIRLPDEIAGLEPEMDSLLRKRLTRGTVTLNVAMRLREASLGYQVNQAMLASYLSGLRQMQVDDDQLTASSSIDLASLLNLPGVIQPPISSEMVETTRPIITRLVGEACEKMIAMRQREGQGLVEDLMAHRQVIADALEQIIERAPMVIEEYHKRLRTRVEEMLNRAQLQVDQVDLVKEVAVFAERSDISEELQRTRAHLEQFEQIVNHNENEPAGRTLDFLAQELLREANTVASKSNDAQISRLIVQVKGAIDRIKEQVQNVE